MTTHLSRFILPSTTKCTTAELTGMPPPPAHIVKPMEPYAMTAYKRFKNLADMTAFAVAHHEANGMSSHIADVTIYSDDSIWYRPSLILVTPGQEDIQLRWFAFSDQEDTMHIGKRARRDAREAGEWFQDQVQSAMNTARLVSCILA